MGASKTVINVEGVIGKTVGHRRPPEDSMVAGLDMQRLTHQVMNVLGHRLAPKGVYRFRTHREANEWTLKNIRPKKKTV